MLYKQTVDPKRKFELNQVAKKAKRELWNERDPSKFKKVDFNIG